MPQFCYDFPRPAVTTDICLFRLNDGDLEILLIKRNNETFRGYWALPGGFVREAETLDQCAIRELKEETGVIDVPCKGFATFSEPGRDPRGRVITFAYFALLPEPGPSLSAGTDADAAQWFSTNSLPELAFDHAAIVTAAKSSLIANSMRTPILLSLMPRRFTLTQLQTAYEAVEGRELDKRNFRRWIMETGWLLETGEHARGRNRPAMLFQSRKPIHDIPSADGNDGVRI